MLGLGATREPSSIGMVFQLERLNIFIHRIIFYNHNCCTGPGVGGGGGGGVGEVVVNVPSTVLACLYG